MWHPAYFSEVTSQNLSDASTRFSLAARTLSEVTDEYQAELRDLLAKRKAREGSHLSFEQLLGQAGLQQPSPRDLLTQQLYKSIRNKQTTTTSKLIASTRSISTTDDDIS